VGGLREVDGEVERDVEVLARRAQWSRVGCQLNAISLDPWETWLIAA
jgi:hypothetical protein